MHAIRSTDTKPEMVVRRLVHQMGYRYRLHQNDLPGKPDLVSASPECHLRAWVLLVPARQELLQSGKEAKVKHELLAAQTSANCETGQGTPNSHEEREMGCTGGMGMCS